MLQKQIVPFIRSSIRNSNLKSTFQTYLIKDQIPFFILFFDWNLAHNVKSYFFEDISMKNQGGIIYPLQIPSFASSTERPVNYGDGDG